MSLEAMLAKYLFIAFGSRKTIEPLTVSQGLLVFLTAAHSSLVLAVLSLLRLLDLFLLISALIFCAIILARDVRPCLRSL